MADRTLAVTPMDCKCALEFAHVYGAVYMLPGTAWPISGRSNRWHWQTANSSSPQYDHPLHQSGRFTRQVDKCSYRGDQAVVHHQIGASSDYLFTFDRQHLHPPLTNNIEVEIFSPQRSIMYLEPRELPQPDCVGSANLPRFLGTPPSMNMSSSGLTAEQKISSRRDHVEKISVEGEPAGSSQNMMSHLRASVLSSSSSTSSSSSSTSFSPPPRLLLPLLLLRTTPECFELSSLALILRTNGFGRS
ncbi:unnamed protein product [Schistocephalus solidus]|uniref:Expressed conserved protein n=1 Tax=Schistocephalus solidus TaxID=70667 RepID=A0A183SER9_SCHSO|nr:unnamed protein product [Schistocephalus solidus]